MLAVFIDEVAEGCFAYIEQISKIMLSMTSYEANESIRQSTVNSLPGLIKAAKAGGIGGPQLFAMAKVYNENIYKALEKEFDTDTLILQVQAMKDIVLEAGPGLYNQEEINELSKKGVTIVQKSLERITENENLKKEQPDDEDDALDQDDLALLKEETQNEHDLQVSAAEFMGCLFKTHKDLVAELVNELRTNVIPAAMSSNDQKRYKFALFILDDMVEHLGPTYFQPADWETIVRTICMYCDHQSAALRQASAYGIGVVAQFSGPAFASFSQLCLESLKKGVEY